MKTGRVAVCALLLLSWLGLASAQITPGRLSAAEIDRVVKAFTSKEAEFRQALNQYGFKRDAKVQTIGFGGQVTGEYRRVSAFTFDDGGKKFEKITFFPQPTLTEISMTAEDLEDLSGVNPFALEADKVDRYNFNYVGQERIDELDLYVFDVTPKVMPDPKKSKERLFSGRVWVDNKDLQIVKTKGKGVPETKTNKFPVFETYREQIDGRYWFPTYTYSNDQLVFDSGQTVRLKMLVTYTDFKRFSSKVRIIEDVGEPGIGVEDKSDAPPVVTPTPTPAPVSVDPSLPAPPPKPAAKPTPTPKKP